MNIYHNLVKDKQEKIIFQEKKNKKWVLTGSLNCLLTCSITSFMPSSLPRIASSPNSSSMPNMRVICNKSSQGIPITMNKTHNTTLKKISKSYVIKWLNMKGIGKLKVLIQKDQNYILHRKVLHFLNLTSDFQKCIGCNERWPIIQKTLPLI